MRDLVERPWLIKICGVTTLGDADLVVEAGADALGVLLTASPRRVSRERAGEIVHHVRGRLVRVGVVRGDDDVDVDDLELDALQVHGPLSEELASSCRERGLAVVKALSIGSAEFAAFDDAHVSAILVDGARPGSGEEHGWSALGERSFRQPVIAAGGLRADNVAAVVSAWPVWGVDVASGVESSPGVKDPRRVADFVRAARAAFEAREGPHS